MNLHEFQKSILKKYARCRVPVSGTFELTGRCNFNCRMCYVHTKSNEEFQKTEHNGDWWIEQIDEACNRGMLFALLTGGECLLHPDFRRIYTHLRTKGVYTRINTNGFLLTQEMIDFFKENPPFEIQVTLYGSDDDSYEKVTGVRAFQRIEATIHRLKESGLNFLVAVTPNSYASRETEQIVQFLKELQVSYSINEAMFTPYNEAGQQTISNHEVEVEERVHFLKLQKGTEVVGVPEEELPHVGGTRTEPLEGIRCSAGRVSFVLNHEGYMQPCVSMYHLKVPVNTAEDFGQAWEKMISIADGFFLPVECEGCAYKKVCLPCPVHRSGKVGNGHCDPAVCEMTRKLVAAGVKKLDQKPQSCEE